MTNPNSPLNMHHDTKLISEKKRINRNFIKYSKWSKKKTFTRFAFGAGGPKSAYQVGLLELIEILCNSEGRTIIPNTTNGCSAGCLVAACVASTNQTDMKTGYKNAYNIFKKLSDDDIFDYWRPENKFLKIIMDFLYNIGNYIGIILEKIKFFKEIGFSKKLIPILISTLYALINNKRAIMNSSRMIDYLENLFKDFQLHSLILTSVSEYYTGNRNMDPDLWLENGMETAKKLLGNQPLVDRTTLPYIINLINKNLWSLVFYSTCSIPGIFIPLSDRLLKKKVKQIRERDDEIITQKLLEIIKKSHFLNADGGIYDNIPVTLCIPTELGFYSDLLKSMTDNGTGLQRIHTINLFCSSSRLYKEKTIEGIISTLLRALSLLNFEISLTDITQVNTATVEGAVAKWLNSTFRHIDNLNEDVKTKEMSDFMLFQKYLSTPVKIFDTDGKESYSMNELEIINDYMMVDFIHYEWLEKDFNNGRYKCLDGTNLDFGDKLPSENELIEKRNALFHKPAAFTLTFANAVDFYDYAKYLNYIIRMKYTISFQHDNSSIDSLGQFVVKQSLIKSDLTADKPPPINNVYKEYSEAISIFEAYVDNSEFGYDKQMFNDINQKK